MNNWKVKIAIVFLAVSLGFYTLHYMIFNDFSFIIRYVIAQLGFLPISALIVSFVINHLMSRNEKAQKMKKLNMVIGAFFSEVGTEALGLYEELNNENSLKERFSDLIHCNHDRFTELQSFAKDHTLSIRVSKGDIEALNSLKEKRIFLLGLLQNPNLLEHDEFTDMLWSMLHVLEELSIKEDYSSDDLEHLAGDIKRAYNLLIIEWIKYLEHLKSDYPYLFSLAIRTNPYTA